MQADQLETAQDLTQILKFLGSWLWLLPIALWAVALWLARGRRGSILRTIAFGDDSGRAARIGAAPPRRLVHHRRTRAVDGRAACGQRRLGHPDRAAPRRRLHVHRARRHPARGALARRLVTERRLRAERARAVSRSPRDAFGVAGGLFLLLLWWSPTVQTTRVPLMLAAAVILAFGVEVLRRQTAREIPDPPAARPGWIRPPSHEQGSRRHG